MLYLCIMDPVVVDNDLGLAHAAPGLGAIGLGLCDGLAGHIRSLGKDDGGKDYALSTRSRKANFAAVAHFVPPTLSMSFWYSAVYSGFSL